MLTNAEFLGTLSSKLCDDKDEYGLFPCAESRRVVKGGRGGVGISPWSSALNGLLLGATGLSRYRKDECPPNGGNSGGTTASAALSEGLGRFFRASRERTAGGASPAPTLRRNVAAAQKLWVLIPSVSFADSSPWSPRGA